MQKKGRRDPDSCQVDDILRDISGPNSLDQSLAKEPGIRHLNIHASICGSNRVPDPPGKITDRKSVETPLSEKDLADQIAVLAAVLSPVFIVSGHDGPADPAYLLKLA